MDWRADDLPASQLEHLTNSLVVPRPIAWVSSESRHGVLNLAPFSYFNLVSSAPPVVMISFSPKGKKDTLANLRDTGQFVVNVASHAMRHAMVRSSIDVGAEVDEMALLSLTTAPSSSVSPPRLADASAALECRLHQVVDVFGSTMVLGQVSHLHVADAVLREDRVVPELLAPVARLGGSLYTTVTSTYRLDRPSA